MAAYWGGDKLWVTPAEMGKRDTPYIETTERTLTDEGLENSSARLLPSFSVILSSRAPIGHLAINTVPMATNQGCKGLVPSNRIEAKFLYYYLLSIVPILNDLGTGATFKELSGGKLREVVVPVPSLPEQRRIVGILDEAFDGIATATANAERNIQNARAVFESQAESVLTQDSEGWSRRRLGDLCRVRTGKKDVNQGNPAGRYPFFTCAADHTYSDSYSFDSEALLIAGNGNVGQVAYYSGKFEAYQRTYVLSDFAGVSAKYLYRVLNKRLSRTVSKQKLGNTMPYIKIGMLTEFEVPVPPSGIAEGEVQQHLECVADLSQRLEALYEQKLEALGELKRSLLHQAFSGEL